MRNPGRNPGTNIVYRAVWRASNTVFRLLYRTEAYGLENVPVEGPFLLACNHESFLDPPAFGSFCPRELHYFARKTLFTGKFGEVISNCNAIPIERDADSDLGSFRKVFGVIKDGGALLVFPEGTRSASGELGRAKKGIGLIACRAGAPVVPARIFGAFSIWGRQRKFPQPFGNVRIVFGKPIPISDFDPGKSDPERYQTAADRIMEGISALELPRKTEV